MQVCTVALTRSVNPEIAWMFVQILIAPENTSVDERETFAALFFGVGALIRVRPLRMCLADQNFILSLQSFQPHWIGSEL
jgi:hypothetical protein